MSGVDLANSRGRVVRIGGHRIRVYGETRPCEQMEDAAPGLRAAMTDVVPPDSRGVGASAMALTSSLLGTALAPVLVGGVSDVTGSLVTAFYLTFTPVIFGLMLLLRARHTLEDDARAIVTAIYAENQLLERQRSPLGQALLSRRRRRTC